MKKGMPDKIWELFKKHPIFLEEFRKEYCKRMMIQCALNSPWLDVIHEDMKKSPNRRKRSKVVKKRKISK